MADIEIPNASNLPPFFATSTRTQFRHQKQGVDIKIEISENLIGLLLEAIKTPTVGATVVALFGICALATICHALSKSMKNSKQ